MEQTFHERLLGEDRGPIEVSSVADFREAALALAQQARRTLRIFTRDLDHAAYDNEPFQQAVTALARRSRGARIEVLVQDSLRAVKEGHRLVNAAQRFTSMIEIRKPHPDYADYNQAFLVVDATGYLRRPLSDRYDCVGSFNDRYAARELEKFFGEVWERSEPDPQLRRLYL